MSLRSEAAQARAALAAAWATLPEALRGPTQFLGRQYAGCGATIGIMPRCDFTCRGCYLGTEANRSRPVGLDAAREQLRALRAWLGPGGNLQLTDGEVTLRAESEVIELIREARAIGLVPMLMTHGETFRRKPGLLERLMTEGGLTEVSFHVDATMRGRRDGHAPSTSESELADLRGEFAAMIRTARRRTGRRLDAASTVTVTRERLHEVPGIVRWFLRNADAFKMVSFQPLASVGRTDRALAGVGARELWSAIAAGAALRDGDVERVAGALGHPSCSRFVQGLVSRNGERFVPLYHADRDDEMTALHELLDRLGGTSFRLDDAGRRAARAALLVARHGTFLLRRVLPHLVRRLREVGTIRPRYFCIVSHHFMSAAELATPLGRERLDTCAFRVPIDGRLESMCAVNALGLRDAVYRAATPHAGAA